MERLSADAILVVDETGDVKKAVRPPSVCNGGPNRSATASIMTGIVDRHWHPTHLNKTGL